jgi:regulator of nucleoside diphosphate kinase
MAQPKSRVGRAAGALRFDDTCAVQPRDHSRRALPSTNVNAGDDEKPPSNRTDSPSKPDKETRDMKKRPIIMNAADHTELSLAIAAVAKLSDRGHGEVKALQDELARAQIVAPENLQADVITMNSRAELLDLHSQELMEFTLVFPVDANIEEGKISVLAPLGTAMLGYRVGDEFEWQVPYGARRLKVTHVYFQPEAKLKKAA